jgi:hypothetical protein
MNIADSALSPSTRAKPQRIGQNPTGCPLARFEHRRGIGRMLPGCRTGRDDAGNRKIDKSMDVPQALAFVEHHRALPLDRALGVVAAASAVCAHGAQ